mgnify:CR=1 FL=1
MSKVATRFAPSPTGPLHIGGVRTALFNWLFAKSKGGNFLLRIEDTDKERSKKEYQDQIIQSLKWIGINYDSDEYIQSSKISSHIKIAEELLKKGNAYKCYCSNEEIEEQKKRDADRMIYLRLGVFDDLSLHSESRVEEISQLRLEEARLQAEKNRRRLETAQREEEERIKREHENRKSRELANLEEASSSAMLRIQEEVLENHPNLKKSYCANDQEKKLIEVYLIE